MRKIERLLKDIGYAKRCEYADGTIVYSYRKTGHSGEFRDDRDILVKLNESWTLYFKYPCSITINSNSSESDEKISKTYSDILKIWLDFELAIRKALNELEDPWQEEIK